MQVDVKARHELAGQLPALRPVMGALALRLTRNPHDAEDLVQETLHRGLERAHLYRANTQLRAWLVTLMHNIFLDRCRAVRRERNRVVEGAAVESVAAPSAEEAALFEQFSADDVRKAADHLSPEFKETYLLHAFEGLSYAAMALKLGIEKNTVGTRLLRARAQLKTLLLARKGLSS
jgi:RNA polymerase sigma-70 factor, ECF subfamily